MQIKLFLFIFFLAILVQPVLAIDSNAKNVTLQMTAILENSVSQLQFNYAENINDGRGITFGCIGFCTGTYDGNVLIKYYTTLNQSNTLAKYIPSLDAIDAVPHTAAGGDGNPSVVGLSGFITDVQNCNDPLFTQAQLYELDQFYWNPAVSMWNTIGAKNALTLAFIYDMSIRHGANGAQNIINQASLALGGTPKTGIDENTFLSKMFTIRDAALKSENLGDVDRDAGYKTLLASGNVDLNTPFTFTAYSTPFITTGYLGIDIAITPMKENSPVAEFSTNTISGSVPLSVQFTDRSQNAIGWNWNFGDGTNSTQQNPMHTYSAAGNYTVNLTAINANGTDSKTLNITVHEAPFEDEVLPVANFKFNVTGGPAPLSVLFSDFSQNAAERSWDFNSDGAADSSDASPVYVYTAPGNYIVSFKVSNANGNASETAIITVLTESNSSIDNRDSSHSSGGGSSGGGAGASPEPQSNVEAKEISQTLIASGSPVKFDFPQKATPVLYLSFNSNKTTGKTTTIVEMLKGKSTLVSELPSGEVYKSLNIWVGNSGFATPNNIENAIVCFKVEKSWIQDKNIDMSSIALNKYNDGKWNPLSTNLSGEDETFLYFTAKIPGFSPLAITGKTTVKEAVTETQSEAVTETQYEPNIQGLEQNTGNTAVNTEQTPGQTLSPNTSEKGKTTAPSFDIVCGIVSLLAVFLHKKIRK